MVPVGRLSEWQDREDAYLLAYSFGPGIFSECAVYRYASRGALRAFCKRGSSHVALVKDAVHPTMLTNPNTEIPDPSVPVPCAATGGAK